jgi:hypothetical protein
VASGANTAIERKGLVSRLLNRRSRESKPFPCFPVARSMQRTHRRLRTHVCSLKMQPHRIGKRLLHRRQAIGLTTVRCAYLELQYSGLHSKRIFQARRVCKQRPVALRATFHSPAA